MDCPDPEVGTRLARVPQARFVLLFNTHYARHRSTLAHVAASGNAPAVQCRFGAWYDAPPPGHDALIVWLPRERDAVEMTFTMAAQAACPGAEAWVTGKIRDGARPAAGLLRRIVGPAAKIASGRHSLLYRAIAGSHPGSGKSLDSWSRAVSVDFRGRTVQAVSFPGVFSHGRLDPGTNLLLATLSAPPPRTERVLDIGCGSGLIGACIALGWPGVEVDLVDVSARAVEASRRTLALNGLDPARAWPSDLFSDVPRRYDLIVCNPPFHAGGVTDYGMVEALARLAGTRLTRHGRLRVVANRFLKYPSILKPAFHEVVTVRQDTAYRVLEASRPRERR